MLGMINPTTDAITEFGVPTSDFSPYQITSGPDGNLWFTDAGTGSIGTINPSTDAITEYPVPYTGTDPVAITAGPDGNVWFTDPGQERDRRRHPHRIATGGDAAAAGQRHGGEPPSA